MYDYSSILQSVSEVEAYHNSKVHLIPYELLIDDPDTFVARLSEAIGVKLSPDLIDARENSSLPNKQMTGFRVIRPVTNVIIRAQSAITKSRVPRHYRHIILTQGKVFRIIASVIGSLVRSNPSCFDRPKELISKLKSNNTEGLFREWVQDNPDYQQYWNRYFDK